MIDLLLVPQRLRAMHAEAEAIRRHREREKRLTYGTPEKINERNAMIRARYEELRSLRKVGSEFKLSHEGVRKALRPR